MRARSLITARDGRSSGRLAAGDINSFAIIKLVTISIIIEPPFSSIRSDQRASLIRADIVSGKWTRVEGRWRVVQRVEESPHSANFCYECHWRIINAYRAENISYRNDNETENSNNVRIEEQRCPSRQRSSDALMTRQLVLLLCICQSRTTDSGAPFYRKNGSARYPSPENLFWCARRASKTNTGIDLYQSQIISAEMCTIRVTRRCACRSHRTGFW